MITGGLAAGTEVAIPLATADNVFHLALAAAAVLAVGADRAGAATGARAR